MAASMARLFVQRQVRFLTCFAHNHQQIINSMHRHDNSRTWFCHVKGIVSFFSVQARSHVKGVTTSTSYEYELRVSENKVQLMRIRDENSKFRSNSVSILNVTFA